jgi:hypothetical protein
MDVREDRCAHKRAVMEWASGVGDPGDTPGIGEALYSMSELDLWPDYVDGVSLEQALKCWQVVEACRRTGFPDSLRM